MKNFKFFAMAAIIAAGGLSLTACGTGGDDADIVQNALKKITNTSIPKKITKTNLDLFHKMKIATSSGEMKEVEITYAAEPSDRFEFKYEDDKCYATVTLPNAEASETAVDYKITATATYNKTSASKEFTGTLDPINYSDLQMLTIKEALEKEDGELVTVQGTMYNARDNKGFYLVDETAAVYVHDVNGLRNIVDYGTTIKLRATRATYKGMYSVIMKQLQYNDTASYTIIGKASAFPSAAAKALMESEYSAWNKSLDDTGAPVEDHSAELYRIRGYIAAYSPGSYTNYEVFDENGRYIQFYAADSTVYAEEFKDYLSDSTLSEDGKTTKSNILVDVYIAVYDLQPEKGKWRMTPLAVVPVAK